MNKQERMRELAEWYKYVLLKRHSIAPPGYLTWCEVSEKMGELGFKPGSIRRDRDWVEVSKKHGLTTWEKLVTGRSWTDGPRGRLVTGVSDENTPVKPWEGC